MPRRSSSSRRPSTGVSPPGRGFSTEVVEARSGLCVLRVQGRSVDRLFAGEAGGHRWQRIPDNEKRGRVHTSTITVAILPEPTEAQVQIHESDLDVTTCRGSGAGGQHRNVTDSAVQMTHRPTGVTVRCESERSQHANRATALATLRARVWALAQERLHGDRAATRRAQVGSGMRGDKRRTIRVQDGQVNDQDGRSWRFKDYVRGIW